MQTLAVVMACVFATLEANAADIFFDFEGDSGDTVVDKLAGDGAQNGILLGNTNLDAFVVPWGSQSLFFDIPDPPPTTPLVNTLEIPDTTFGEDFSLTLAAFIENKDDPNAARPVSRLFSSFGGTSAVGQRILVDYDPSGLDGFAMRAVINNQQVRLNDVPAGMADPGYHHYAVTIDAGDVRLFFNGAEVASGNVGTGYTNTQNIFLGEDPHDVGGISEEQLVGNYDEVLVIERALSASDIAQLAAGMTVSSVVTPTASERGVYFDFEGDTNVATDKFSLDGSQDGAFLRDAGIDGTSARLGDRSARFGEAGDPPDLFSQIKVGEVGSLGSRFTLSAVVNVPSGGYSGGTLARLFTTYQGSGNASGKLIFDVDPNATNSIGGTQAAMRLLLPDGTSIVADAPFSLFEDHTLTAVYEFGNVTLYLDGVEVANGAASSFGPVDLGPFDLFIGEDLRGSQRENFQGNMDDVLILSRALTSEQVASLHSIGAGALLPTLPPVTGLPGDYNGDGVVDAIDYAVWRENLGSSITLETENPTAVTPGLVDTEDFEFWKSRFGATAVSGANTGPAVPEPATATFVLLGLSGALGLMSRHKSC